MNGKIAQHTLRTFALEFAKKEVSLKDGRIRYRTGTTFVEAQLALDLRGRPAVTSHRVDGGGFYCLRVAMR